MRYQQGDVILDSIESLPSNLKAKNRQDNVLAEGEATGHHHRVHNGTILEDAENPNMIYVEANENAFLTHEEHGRIDLNPGLYRFNIVREYDYEKEESRRVID